MKYFCKRCGHSDRHKGNFLKHLNRTNPCKVILLDIPNETLIKEFYEKPSEKPLFFPPNPSFSNFNTSIKSNDSSKLYKCEFCNKKFGRLDNLKRHIEKICKEKQKENTLKDEEIALIKQIITQKDEDMALMKKQIEILMRNMGNINIETQNNTTNITTNIQINGWGEEDRLHLTDKFYRFCYDRPFTSIPRVIEAVFFNPNCPKNWNVMIKDDKSSKAFVYDREKDIWLKKEKDGVVESLMHTGYSMLDENFDKQKQDNKLTNKLIEKFTKFQDFYAKGDKEYEKRLAIDIKELLINYKAYHIVK